MIPASPGGPGAPGKPCKKAIIERVRKRSYKNVRNVWRRIATKRGKPNVPKSRLLF